MPEESKRNQPKGRNDAKEQRKPRHGRHQGGKEKEGKEKKHDTPAEPKVPVPQKSVYEEPGPEFYKNLKRETDEILKITEEANSKYKKKEIQSNWAKYEMPIESYDEIEEQENMGADYEKLIEAPLSVGGHFQFKHEKSWDTDTGPSPYDKYFEINMDNLALSISTIPFYERINIDKSIFSETDMLNMNNRATRFKQKYYNDKSFTTPELQVQDKILSSLMGNKEKVDSIETNYEETEENSVEQKDHINVGNETLTEQILDLPSSIIDSSNINKAKVPDKNQPGFESEPLKATVLPLEKLQNSKDLDSLDDLISGDQIKNPQDLELKTIEIPNIKDMEDVIVAENRKPKQDESKNVVIESPEDLEKWLDDFLDG
ncbi:uncharacterized protein LOC135078162 [Ostrinia nubilalis]|uniref:uncharacterized protein LOC135078162 n=1 Tax=Ostrinia nubilalis TaxID=29057 RepID=UPI0030825B12